MQHFALIFRQIFIQYNNNTLIYNTLILASLFLGSFLHLFYNFALIFIN